jgi:hypothetical protein
MQPPAPSRKVSDEFTVPLCRIHHRLVHREGNEAACGGTPASTQYDIAGHAEFRDVCVPR